MWFTAFATDHELTSSIARFRAFFGRNNMRKLFPAAAVAVGFGLAIVPSVAATKRTPPQPGGQSLDSCVALAQQGGFSQQDINEQGPPASTRQIVRVALHARAAALSRC